MRRYSGEDYERGFVHIYQALNFLFQQDLEGAGVEIRRLNRLQRELQDANQAAIDNQREKALKDLPVDAQATQAQLETHFDEMDAAARRAQHAFQNVYGFVISGLIYEARGELNDAYIDYKKAHQLNPNLPFLQDALLTLSKKLGFEQAHQQWQEAFNTAAAPTTAKMETTTDTTTKQGNVVVLYEQNLIPPKQSVTLNFLDLSNQYHSISFPVYQQVKTSWRPLKITTTRQTSTHQGSPSTQAKIEQTHLLTETLPMAAKALKDQRTRLLIRQLSRSLSKAQLHHLSEKEGGAIGGLLANIYNIVTERADLRSWLTLPQSLQATRFKRPTGEYTLTIRAPMGAEAVTTPIEITEDHITLIYVVSIGSTFYVRQTTL